MTNKTIQMGQYHRNKNQLSVSNRHRIHSNWTTLRDLLLAKTKVRIISMKSSKSKARVSHQMAEWDQIEEIWTKGILTELKIKRLLLTSRRAKCRNLKQPSIMDAMKEHENQWTAINSTTKFLEKIASSLLTTTTINKRTASANRH